MKNKIQDKTLKMLSIQIKKKLDLVDKIKQYNIDLIPLSDNDTKFKALCPFHAEKTASFMIRPVAGGYKQFKCFGCGVSGSVIDFVSLIEGLDLNLTIRKLAEEVQTGGIEPLEEVTKQKIEIQELERKVRDEKKLLMINAYISKLCYWHVKQCDLNPVEIKFIDNFLFQFDKVLLYKRLDLAEKINIGFLDILKKRQDEL